MLEFGSEIRRDRGGKSVRVLDHLVGMASARDDRRDGRAGIKKLKRGHS